MFINASFSYRKATSVTRDENGFAVRPTNGELIAGTLCQLERETPAKQNIGADGQEFVYEYTCYVPIQYWNRIEIGDTMIVVCHGKTVERTVKGTDDTDRRILKVCL